MNRRIGKYSQWLPLVLAVLAILSACKREPVIEENITGGRNLSVFQTNVVKLDTLIFSNPVKTGTQVRFDLIGTPPAIKTGDIVFYPGTGELYGKVTSAVTVGSRMVLQLDKATLGQIFQTLLINDESSKGLVKSRTRLYPERWKSDTLELTGMYVFNDFWQSRLLQVQFESGKFYASPGPSQFTFSGQGSDPWFDRLGFSMKYAMTLNGTITITTGSSMDATDSVRVERKVCGPFIVGGFPVTYQVDTWMGFHVVAASDTVMSMQLSGQTNGILSLKYDYWDAWEFSGTSTGKSALMESFSGPRINSYAAEFFVNQVVTPVFCGEPALSAGNRYTANMESSVAIPDWERSQQVSEQAWMTSTGLVFGNDVPARMGTSKSLLYLDSQTGVLENQKPTASFVINPKTGFTDTNFEFDASASSDLETLSANLKVRWDFDADGHFDTEYNTLKIAYHKFTQAGSYSPILEVQDEGGRVSQSSASLEVSLSSSAPIAYFTVTPQSGRVSDVFYFDAQGCYDGQDPVDQLKVRWDFNGDGVWDTNWSTRKIEYYLFRTPGSYVAKLEVLDTQGLSGSTTRIIDVASANIKPNAIYKVTPENGTIETKFNFDASGCTDPETTVADLQVRWDWNGDGVWDTDYSKVKTIQHIFPVAGVYTVVMEVIDLEGYGATYSQDITVKELNTYPVADFSINPSPGKVDQTITFDASLCSDQEDSLDVLKVRWDWNNDNVYETEFSTVKVITNVFNAPGTYIIRVQVMDSGGLTDTRVRLLKIE